MITSDYAFRQNAFQIYVLTTSRRKTPANQELLAKRTADARACIARLQEFADYQKSRVADTVNAQIAEYQTILDNAIGGKLTI